MVPLTSSQTTNRQGTPSPQAVDPQSPPMQSKLMRSTLSKITDENRKLFHDYVNSTAIRGLHIGCGPNIKTGWLNSDYTRHGPDVFVMDATKEFPLPDNAFDYVYTEHMIEHIEFGAGVEMLRQAGRVLKSGGIIRVVTPDVGFLLNLYSHNRTQLEDRYIRWQVKSSFPSAPRPLAGFVFNIFVRSWNHKFIYDRETLTLALESAGFTSVVERNIMESDHEFLTDLENVSRMPRDYLKLESMIFEAIKGT